jgi:tetratricopeptide (TPR) repeat protein
MRLTFQLMSGNPAKGSVLVTRTARKKICALLVLAFLIVLPHLQGQTSSLDQARALVAARSSPEEAKSLLAKAIASDPKNAEAHYLLGEILYAFGDYKNAADEAQKAVTLDDSKSDYHLLLGNALSGLVDSAGMFKKMSLARQMKAEFERAVALDPKNIPARTSLLEFYVQAPSLVGGGSDKALEQAKQINALDPLEGHYAMAVLYFDQKKFAQSEDEYKTAIDADPKRAKSYSELAFLYIQEKKDSDAAPAFKRAFELDPNYLPACFGVARSDLLSGQNLDEAERLFKKYLTRWPEENEPSLANAHWRLGQVYEKENKKELAVAEWKEAQRLAPNFKPAQDSLKAAGK